MWYLIYERYHIPSADCVHEHKEFKYAGQENLRGATWSEIIEQLITMNNCNPCWKYVPIRWVYEEIN